MKKDVNVERILKSYLKKDSSKVFREFPVKYQYQLIVCKYIVSFLDADKTYTEKEINSLLKEFYYDYATLRRYLIDFSLLGRHKDGSLYWVKKKNEDNETK